MLISEAKWIGSVLARLPDPVFPVVNIGSGTAEDRETRQPWVEEYIFEPLAVRGAPIIHVDVRGGPGVDAIIDVMADYADSAVRALCPRTLLCSNLLEHVPDVTLALKHLTAAVPEGGYLLLSGPTIFPYHAVPIDNMFRPDCEEVARLIADDLLTVEACDIPCRRLGYYMARDLGWPRLVARLMLPIYKPRAWLERIQWVGRRTSAYGLLMQRNRNSGPWPTCDTRVHAI